MDRWWTNEEKIALGIEDDIDTVDVSQFVTLLQDVATSIVEYQEPLKELEKKSNPHHWRTIKIGNAESFTLITSGIGKNRTILKDLNTECQDDIPVYTAGKEAVAYIHPIEGKPPIFASLDKPLLSFASNGDGSAGRNFVIHQRPFYINTDRIAIRVNVDGLLPEYLHIQLIDMKKKYGFNHSNKANKKHVAEVVINIPCNADDSIDILCQQTAIELLNAYMQATDYVVNTIEHISGLSIRLDGDKSCTFKSVTLSNDTLFELSIGERLLKKDYVTVTGEVPAYSANVHTPFAYVKESNVPYTSYSHVIWGIDGDFNFCVKECGEAFAITDHCGAIRIKDSSIPAYYLMYQLDLVKKRYGFDRGLRASLQNMETIEIQLPYTIEGHLDYEYMQQVSRKYCSLVTCRADIVEQLNRLTGRTLQL